MLCDRPPSPHHSRYLAYWKVALFMQRESCKKNLPFRGRRVTSRPCGDARARQCLQDHAGAAGGGVRAAGSSSNVHKPQEVLQQGSTPRLSVIAE
ncbi:hypothetical protein E2C01_054743 [Portunus trituberculatus]|uniref:Uncharacterized protein n=1 Tax=Portunus trituberculatus TaxID=210409 RepID=A0A5B7GU38_PORTR|nr:hypothetical protein [Portunus trituberculatus]